MQKILIVEDSKSIQRLIGAILKDLGAELSFAFTGKETHEILSEQVFDLLILDLVLPDTTGYELLPELDSERFSNNVIVLTSLSDKQQLMRGFSMGANDFIRKPFDHDEFKARIKSSLEAIATKKQLQQETAKLNHFFNNSNLLIQSTDHTGLIREVNKTWYRSMGYTEEDLEQGIHFQKIIAEDELNHCMDIFKEIMSGNTVDTFRTKFVKKNGDLILVEGNVIAYNNGQTTFTQGVFKDITESEEQIRQINLLSKSVEHSGSSVFITNLDGEITYANKQLEESTGYTLEEIQGKKPNIFKSGEHPDALYRDLWKKITSGNTWRGEIQNKRKDNSLVWNLVTISPVLNADDKPYAFVCIKEDISNRKETELRLNQALLAQREATKIKQDMIGIASHQFRTPLTVIQANSDLLMLLKNDLPEERRISIIDKINHRLVTNVNHMVHLIDDVLMMNKLDSGKMQYNPSMVDIKSVIDNLVTEYNQIQKDQRIVTYRIMGKPVEIKTDEKLIENSISNLLSNAFKYSEGRFEPELTLIYEDDEVIIKVVDYGDGIEEGAENKIFDPFYRAKKVENLQGTGLGLNIVKQCIDLIGGTIEVHNTDNAGACFTISLPHIN